MPRGKMVLSKAELKRRKARMKYARTFMSPKDGGLAVAAKRRGIHSPDYADARREGEARGRHTRWHTNRGIRKSWCKFCRRQSKAEG